MSSLTKWKTEARHAIEDAYGNLMFGDDAGKSARLVVILQPPPALFLSRNKNRLASSLGIQFVEIAGRAYVQELESSSPAALQGVQIRDCVQYAAVLAKEWRNPLSTDYEEIAQQALERESSGQRISYSDLKRILERGMLQDAPDFLSPPTVPTTISVGHSSATSPNNDLTQARPLVVVFRRTRQRLPEEKLLIAPHFRLDDECDVATQILKNLCNNDGQEARTIRNLLVNATGLAFIRGNKFTCGVSVHGGSGIVMAKQEDGSWSPPSAIGMYGMGLGLQLGVEVTHTLVILQTHQALEHFMRGSSFQVGAHVGAAMFEYGREAVGAASVSGALCGSTQILEFAKEDEYDYGGNKGKKNSSSPNDAPAGENQLINGITPMVAYAMAEGFYAGVSLEGSRIFPRHDINERAYQFFFSQKNHSKPITPQEILQSKVPMPPEAETLMASLLATEFAQELTELSLSSLKLSSSQWKSSDDPIATDETLALKYQSFLFGGIAVKHTKERMLWLYMPGPQASCEIGFVSRRSERHFALSTNKIFHQSAQRHDKSDAQSTASEDLTLDSALIDTNSVFQNMPAGTSDPSGATMRVEMSRKHSIPLTSVTKVSLSNENRITIEADEGMSLVFNTFEDEQALFLFHVLKVVLDYETSRLNRRGSKSQGRRKRNPSNKTRMEEGYSSSEEEDEEEGYDEYQIKEKIIPAGWKAWSKSPGRMYLQNQASLNALEGCPKYIHGQLLVREICKKIVLPVPLPFCRVLLLDSTSPVISQWEQEGGNVDYEKTPWTFPPATPREMDQYQSENQLIASGSMYGAHRTISYERLARRMSETHIVDADDAEKLAFSVNERMPRRGFSIKVKVVIRRSSFGNECEASVLAEIRPIGKNMSNPTAVHKAFLLVLEELGDRYGNSGNGLMKEFLSAIPNLPESSLPQAPEASTPKKVPEEKKEAETGVVKLEDMLKNTQSNRVLNDMDSTNKFKNESRPVDIKGRSKLSGKKKAIPEDDPLETSANAPVMIEVKPLPKIRLSLMPSPREEDEDALEDSKRKKSRSKKSTSPSQKVWSKKPKSKQKIKA